MLWTLSYRHRKWWRNLRGGATVTLRLQGRDVTAQADVLESREQVKDGLSAYLRRTPQAAKYLGVKLDQERDPDRDDVAKAAESMVMIRFRFASRGEQK